MMLKTNKACIVRRSFSIILPLCIFSLFISGLICSVTNDIYAFVKEDKEIILNFDKEELFEVAQTLSDNGVLDNSLTFVSYVKIKNKTKLIEGFAGDIKLNSSMSYREILSEFSECE